MRIYVQPTPLIVGNKQVGIIDSIHINNVQIILNNGAFFDLAFLDADEETLGNRRHVMDTETYLEWGKDDGYVVDYLLAEFELTKRQPEPETEQPNEEEE